ncbi:MAG: hypothetical protein ACFFB5_01950 [Promethearchaeota archaeon]
MRGILCLVGFGGILPLLLVTASKGVSVEYTIENIWNKTDAQKITLTRGRFFLVTEDNEIILVEQNQNKSVFQSNETIAAFVVINHTLIFTTFEHSHYLFFVSFNNDSDPQTVSKITTKTTGLISFLDTFDEFVFTANYEWGFLIYDFTNVTHPQLRGYITLDNWHCQQVFIVSQYGFFSGDHKTGIYNLSGNPLVSQDPHLLWSIDYKNSNFEYFLRFAGRPAVSNEYFVINHRSSFRELNMFHIIPLMSTTSKYKRYSVNYDAEKGYRDCGLIDEDVLVVSGVNNTVSVFRITENHDLDFLTDIYLGDGGSIEYLLQIEGTNDFLVADGANGLLKLSLDIIISSSVPTRSPSFSLLNVFLIILVLIFVRRFQKPY